MPLIDSLTIDDLPEGLQYLAERAGMDVVRALLTYCPGMEIRVPMRLTHRAAKRYVLENFSQSRNNVKELAFTLKLTERRIQQILKEPADRVAA